MPQGEYSLSSGFSLSGGTLGAAVAVKKFSGLQMDVEVSSTTVGNQQGGKKKLEPRPGPTKPGQPTFVCPIPKGDMTLVNWWVENNPNATQGGYKIQDLTFTYIGDNSEVHAEWQLKGAFPMKYEVSDADDSNAELVAETIQLCVTEIVRMR